MIVTSLFIDMAGNISFLRLKFFISFHLIIIKVVEIKKNHLNEKKQWLFMESLNSKGVNHRHLCRQTLKDKQKSGMFCNGKKKTSGMP